MNRKGILFVISGPSGVGKGTIKSALLKETKDIHLSISATTRLPREGEIDGKDYYFIGKNKFQKMIDNNDFLEWAKVYKNLYGTPLKNVKEKLKNGQDVLLEIDIQGALQVKSKYPQGVYIFISPPSIEELVSRLCTRGQDSQESISIRLANCKEEMEHMKYYNYVVINDNLNEAVKKAKAIIVAERCKIDNFTA
ncbi:Guanylate kinase [Candidatus Syntrophocurvum alkaliphilum]|uniref:Guanylate kinase n=1 Tax=Candidatus Syntrophocurvum alkaliphilum TaxID=2293317 RepID=A0A6I6DH40_9FIRM|nr:guanylate kinase [Candidatus Syntrophocurvum alkaliphilum]QGT99623.1 Guanylate kinase [Candidatus Syntrophocurvum alkaliphilum]